jgi:uncharacterized membrane protein
MGELAAALLTGLEASALGEALRGSGVWTYGILNLVHVLGIGMLLGAVLILDLRLLGVWRDIPLRSVAAPTVQLSAAGVLVAMVSGVLMLSVNGADYVGNPFLYVKLPLLGVALLNVLAVQRLAAWRRMRAGAAADPGDHRLLAAVGGVSLVLWLAIVVCGRMIGYW